MVLDFNRLKATVQHNCHIADAQHAGDYTLCTYLMKMRELYRWEQGLEYDAPLTNDEVGQWVRAREAVWETLEDSDFEALPFASGLLDPFANEAVNQTLLPEGYIYSGGLGRKSAPHFFLGELLEHHQHHDYTVLISGREYARDLTSPPAMTRGTTIFVRKESLRRMIWERVQEWRWNRIDNAMGRALAHYPLDEDLEGALDQLVDDQIETLLLHEVGEVAAGQGIEQDWQALLMAVSGTRAELQLRAIRDNLADALETLPHLVEKQQAQTLHFYFATYSSMRRDLDPGLYGAYQDWVAAPSGLQSLEQAVTRSQRHWHAVMREALSLVALQPDGLARAVSELVDKQRLVKEN